MVLNKIYGINCPDLWDLTDQIHEKSPKFLHAINSHLKDRILLLLSSPIICLIWSKNCFSYLNDPKYGNSEAGINFPLKLLQLRNNALDKY